MKKTIILMLAIVLSVSFVLGSNGTNLSNGDLASQTGENNNETVNASTDVSENNETESNTSDEVNLSETNETDNETNDEGMDENDIKTITTVDNETLKQAELIISSNFGAKVRMHQLKREIIKSNIIGAEIIKILSAKNVNVTELNAILSEMALLKDEMNSLDEKNYTVENFVSIKKDLTTFNHDFKKITSKKLSAEDKKALNDALRINPELKNLNNEIQTEIKALNEERVRNVLSKMGKHNQTLLDKIKKGQISPNEIKKTLQINYKNMDQKNRTEFINQIKQKNVQKNDLREKNKERLKLVGAINARNRALKRIVLLKNNSNAIKRINKQIDHLTLIQKRLKINEKKVMAKAEKIKKEILSKKAELRKNSNKKILNHLGNQNTTNKGNLKKRLNTLVKRGNKK